MYEAYTAIPLIKKMPLKVESVAAHGDKLYLGTKDGNLLVYTVVEKDSADGPKFFVHLGFSNKVFAKKPITQLCVIPELNLLISLSDGSLSVHHLSLEPNTPPIDCPALAKCKGCTLFAVNVQEKTTLTGEVKITLMLCAAVKRKLELFYWKNNTFCEHPQGLCVPDTPRSIVWCGDESLLVGFRSEYNILQLSGETKQLFPTGKQPEPLCLKLKENSFALSRDDMTIFVNRDGLPTHKYAVTWSEAPISLCYDYPYLLSAQSFGVEVRTVEPRALIQKVNFLKPRLLLPCKKGQLYVLAPSGAVWCILRTPVQDQIPQVLKDKCFELALKLADLSDQSEEERNASKRHIQNLHAFDLFCKKKFEESLNIFMDLETDPSHVIGLFPDLLPEDYRNSISYPDKVPDLRDADLEAGLYALVDYLVQVRCKLLSDNQHEPALTGIVQGSKTVKSKKQLLQIIDTTMLKCYLETNVALVASLLRLPDNFYHLDECERALKKHQKLSELIILYQQKNQHEKALDLLMREAHKADSPLKGHERTVGYLQHLGRKHMELILRYSLWVLEEHPEEGLKIFVEDQQEKEGEALPRDVVLDFLSKKAPHLVIPYLKHVIHKWNDQTEMFHNTLIHKYIESVRSLLSQQHSPVGPGEPGLVGELRKDLVDFLETSDRYTAENFPTHLLSDGLFEEAAVVMGKLGRHSEALEVYIYVLSDPSKAEQYCASQYNRNPERNRDVFLILLQMYLQPPDEGSRVLDLCRRTAANIAGLPSPLPIPKGCREQNLKGALKILMDHVKEIDPLRALQMLPGDVLVEDVRGFLREVLDRCTKELHAAGLQRSLLFAEHLQVKERCVRVKSLKITLTELDVCCVCQKRIGSSAFARYPDGAVVHYSCREGYESRLAS
ncbi:vacuolar protein sorting 39 [Dermacentor variabilis]|uniref:vacuolar protein sorting 39 n=1 Tax=Dermacentor variabilis TaxID=34621 RepID=UPI003F5B4B28